MILKPAAEGLDSVVANSVRQPMAALMMLGLSLARDQWPPGHQKHAAQMTGGTWKDLRELDRRSWLTIVIASLVGTGLGSLLFVLAIQMVGAGRTAVLTSTAPLMAIPLAVLWLHERPNRWTSDRRAAGDGRHYPGGVRATMDQKMTILFGPASCRIMPIAPGRGGWGGSWAIARPTSRRCTPAPPGTAPTDAASRAPTGCGGWL